MMFNDDTPVEIPGSRTKLAGLFVIAALFVSVGVWFALKPQDIVSPIARNEYLIRMVGIASIVFFGACGLFFLKKLNDNRAAVTISSEGITDHSGAASIGFIPWADITGIRETTVINQKFMTIDVKDPEHYINQQKSSFKKKLLQVNYKQYGTLISISANGLQCHHPQLKKILQDAYKTYGNPENKHQ